MGRGQAQGVSERPSEPIGASGRPREPRAGLGSLGLVQGASGRPREPRADLGKAQGA